MTLRFAQCRINKYHEGNRQKIRGWANPEVV